MKENTYRNVSKVNQYCNEHKKKFAHAFTHRCMPLGMLLPKSVTSRSGDVLFNVTNDSHPLSFPIYRRSTNVILLPTIEQGIGARTNAELRGFFTLLLPSAYNLAIKLGSSEDSITTTASLFLKELDFLSTRNKSMFALSKKLQNVTDSRYVPTAKGLLCVLKTISELHPDLNEYDETAIDLAKRYVKATFTSDNSQIQLFTLNAWQGLEVDDFFWLERQNTPSVIAVRYGEGSAVMNQERHLEYIGNSRPRRNLCHYKKTSETAGRTDFPKLFKLLFEPDVSANPSPLRTEAAAHLAGRAHELDLEEQSQFEVQQALDLLHLPAMPSTNLEIHTAHAKRRREGNVDDKALEDAAVKLRKVLFTQ